MTRSFQGWVVAGAAGLLTPSSLFAQNTGTGQDVGTSTPPELRDFRLDTPPPRPAPEQILPPPTTSTAPTTSAPETRPVVSARDAPTVTQVRPAQRIAEPRPSGAVSSEKPAQTQAPAEPVADAAAATSDKPVLAPDSADSDAAIAKTTAAAKGLPYNFMWVGAVLATLIALVAAALFFRRNRSSGRKIREAAIPSQQPSPPVRLDKPKPQSAGPLPESGPAASHTPAVREPIFAEFKPEVAQLSIASLSVTGKLTIINRGRLPIANLLMRSHMISAQNGQQEAIAAFHDANGDGALQSLGPLAAGERIDAVIEIRQLRTELSTFRWTEREFVAPIILINLAGEIEDAPLELRLSQLIGREGDGTTLRMKPLPIDRGPKRFTDVSARPLFG